MVVVAQLVMIVALHLDHHGSTVTSLNLRVELLKWESVMMRSTLMKLLYWNKYNCIIVYSIKWLSLLSVTLLSEFSENSWQHVQVKIWAQYSHVFNL